MDHKERTREEKKSERTKEALPRRWRGKPFLKDFFLGPRIKGLLPPFKGSADFFGSRATRDKPKTFFNRDRKLRPGESYHPVSRGAAVGRHPRHSSLFKLRHKIRQRNSQRLADLPQFDQIQTPLAALVLGNIGLRHFQLLCDLDLRHASSLPRPAQQILKAFLLHAENGFWHRKSSFRIVDDYPKLGYLLTPSMTAPKRSNQINAAVLLSFAWMILFAALFGGCSKQDWRPVQAEVFITTEGGQTLRLSNVPFSPIPESSLAKIVGIQNSAQEKYAGQRADFASAIDKCIRLGAMANAKELRDDYARTRDYGFHNSVLDDPWGRTDADGKLSLYSLKKEGVYWVAKAERVLPNGEKETYLWMQYVKTGSTSPVRFSNHNLWTVDADADKIGLRVCPKL